MIADESRNSWLMTVTKTDLRKDIYRDKLAARMTEAGLT